MDCQLVHPWFPQENVLADAPSSGGTQLLVFKSEALGDAIA
ncbi:hypothetical protein ACOBQX_24680 [Actinokineospora sp. G85]